MSLTEGLTEPVDGKEENLGSDKSMGVGVDVLREV